MADDQQLIDLFGGAETGSSDEDLIDLFNAPPPNKSPQFQDLSTAEDAKTQELVQQGQRPLPAFMGTPLLESLSAAPSKSVGDAQSLWQSRNHSYVLSARQKDQIESLAQGMAWQTLSDFGVSRPGGTVAAEVPDKLVSDLVGTLRNTLVPLFSPMSEEEQRQVSADAMRRVFSRMQRGWTVKLNQSEDPQEQARLQELIAQSIEFQSRAEDPRIQDIWSHLSNQAIERQQALAPPRSTLSTQLNLQQSLFSDQVRLEGIPRAEVARRLQGDVQGNVLQRMRSLVNHAFDTPGEIGKPLEILSSSFQGTLQANRLRRLGLAEGDFQNAGIGTIALLSNPEVAGPLLEASARVATKKQLGIEIEEAVPPELQGKIDKQFANSLPQMVQTMYLQGLNPLITLQQTEVDPQLQSTAEVVTKAIDTTLGAVGVALQTGVNTVNSTVEYLNSLPDAFLPERENFASSLIRLGFSSGTMNAHKVLRDSVQSIDQLLADARGQGFVGPLAPQIKSATNNWANAETVLNPEGNLFTALSTLVHFNEAQAVMQQGERFGLSPERMMEQYEKVVEEKLREAPVGFSDKERDDAIQRTSRTLADKTFLGLFNPFDNMRTIGDIVRTAVIITGNDLRNILTEVNARPKEGVAALMLLGVAGEGTVPLRARLGKMTSNSLFRKDAIKTIRDAAARDGMAAQDLLEYFSRQSDGQSVGTFNENFKNITANLKTISDLHKVPQSQAASGKLLWDQIKPLSREAVEFGKALKRVSTKSLYETLEVLGADDVTMGLLTRTGVQDLVSRVGAKFSLDRFDLPDFIGKRNQQLAREIQGSIDNGIDLPSWGELPLSLDGMALGGSELRIKWNQLLERAYPKATPIMRSKLLPAGIRAPGQFDGGFMKKLATVYTDSMAKITSHRALAGSIYNNIEDFIETKINRLELDAREAHYDASVMGAPESAALRQKALADIQNLKGQLGDVNKMWDTELDMNKVNWVQDMPVEELIFWGRRRFGDQNFYEAMRKPKESIQDFETRMNELVTRNDRPNFEELERSGKLLKKEIIDEYLRAPGLDTGRINIDLRTGDSLTPSQAKRLRRRRRKLAEATIGTRVRNDMLQEVQESIASTTDPAKLSLLKKTESELKKDIRQDAKVELSPDEAALALRNDMGIGNFEVEKKLWADIRRQAGSDRNFSDFQDPKLYRRMAKNTQELDSGMPIEMQRKALMDLEQTTRLNMGFARHRHGLFLDAMNKLTPKQRELLNTSLTHQARFGKHHSIERLREEMPEVFRPYPRSDDEAVQLLLNEAKDFHKNLLEDLADAKGLGSRFDPTKEFLLSPYTPRRFLTYESNNFLKKDVLKEDSSTTVSSPSGLDLGFFLPRRDIQRFKAVVSVRDGAPVEKLFSNRKEALEWVEERFGGIQEQANVPGHPMVDGKTGFGDSFGVIDPLGAQAAKDLGALGPGESLALRFRDMIEDIGKLRMLNALDRPRWAMDEEDWRAFIRTPEGKASVKNYTRVNSPALGSLNGKRVHKNILGAYEEYVDHFQLGMRLGDVVRQFSSATNWWSKALLGGKIFLTAGPRVAKDMLVANRIARSFKTIGVNYFGDSLIFAPAAADKGILTTRAGWRAGRQARRDLWGYMMQGKLPDDPATREIFEDFLRKGGLDDTSMVGKVDADFAEKMNNLLLGTDEFLPDKVRAYVRGNNDGIERSFKDILNAAVGAAPKLSPRATKLQKRLEQIDNRLQVEDDLSKVLSPEQIDQLVNERNNLERLIGREVEEGLPRDMGRAFSSLYGWLTGAPKGLLKDRTLFSRKFYNYINNVNRLKVHYYNINKGLSADYSVWRVNQFMQSFSRVPKMLRQFGRTPFASPVVSFPYEVIRIYSNMLKYRWPVLMAHAMATNMTNFYSMAVSGIDPYVAHEIMGAHTPHGASDLLTGGLLIPNSDGTFDSAQINGLNPYAFLRYRADPVFGKLIPRSDPGEAGTLEKIGTSLGETVVGSFFGNPFVNTFIGTLQGIDPSNGRPVSNRREALGLNLQNLMRSMIPAETPFIGEYHHQAMKNLETPPYVRSDMRVSLSQKMIQALTTTKLRGRLGTGKGANLFARTVIALTGGAGERTIPNEMPRSFNYTDYLNALWYSSAVFDTNPHHGGQTMRDREFQDLRMANFLEDSGDRAAAEKLRKDARKRAREKWRIEKEIGAATIDTQKDFTLQEAKLMQKARDIDDFALQFTQIPVLRQTVIVLNAAAVDEVPTKIVNDLINKMSFTDSLSFRNRKDTDLALKMVESYLEDPWRSDNLNVIRRLRANLRVMTADRKFFEVKERFDNATLNEYMRQILDEEN